MKREGIVYFDNIECGKITEEDGVYFFQYNSSYLKDTNSCPISVHFPLQSEPFTSDILFPFFDGLIPEGWLLEIAANKYKINIIDRMGFLLRVCEDTIGAVSVKGVRL